MLVCWHRAQPCNFVSFAIGWILFLVQHLSISYNYSAITNRCTCGNSTRKLREEEEKTHVGMEENTADDDVLIQCLTLKMGGRDKISIYKCKVIDVIADYCKHKIQ